MYKKTNLAAGTLSAQLLVGGSSLVLQTDEGLKFPDTGSGNTFVGVIWGAAYLSPEKDATTEFVTAYRSSGDTFTIVRAKEGTSAKQWEVGDNFMLTASKAVFDEYETALGDKADKTNVLELDNTDAFTPDADYEPATKKYVDDNIPAIPVKASAAEINTGTDDAKFATAAAIAGSFIGVKGGWSPLGACTYEAADAPTYTISFASDMTAILSPGMRIKLTDSTVKYFIITAVGAYSGGKTIITVYGGTDYTLSGGAISSPYYSIQKAPFGFPLNPGLWSVIATDNQDRNQASPTQNTWYNLNAAAQLTIPIGCWEVSYMATIQGSILSGTVITAQSTLSTANNSESDADFSAYAFNIAGGNGANRIDVCTAVSRFKTISLASKTTYYLNNRTATASASAIGTFGSLAKTIIRATCAYL
jgi:hypothetical protein